MTEVNIIAGAGGATMNGISVNRRGTLFMCGRAAGPTARVWRSRDCGATWVQVDSQPTVAPDGWGVALVIDKFDNLNFFYQGSVGNWYHRFSNNEGAGWIGGFRGFANADYITVAASPVGFIYGVLCGGLAAARYYFDFNQGDLWTAGGAGFTSYAINWGTAYPGTHPGIDTSTLFPRVLIDGVTGVSTPLSWTSNAQRPPNAAAWASAAVGATTYSAAGNMAYDRESNIFWYAITQPVTFQIFVYRGNPVAGFAQIATLAPANHSFAPHTPMYYDNGVLYMAISNDNAALPYRYYASYDMGLTWTLESQGTNHQWNAVSGMTVAYGKCGLHNEIFTSASDYPAGAANGIWYQGIKRRNIFPGATWPWGGWRGRGRLGAMT